MRTFAAALVAGSMLLAVTGTTTAASAGRADGPKHVVTAPYFGPDFSPDGDGVKDRARLRFALRQRAEVEVTVRHSGAVLLRRALGRLDAGRHRWVWGGMRTGGRVVADGYYTVTFRATAGGRRSTAHSQVRVDRVNPGRLVTSRPTVYPLADAVRDTMVLAFVERGWTPDEGMYAEMTQARTTLRILDHRGRVVWRDRTTGVTVPLFRWDGTDGDGHRLAAGRYGARLTTVDPAGNTRHLARTLRVSDAQLVAEVWTGTVAAADAKHYTPSYGGCNGCADTCDPVASERFARGLSYRPCPDTWGTISRDALGPPFAAAPVDSFRVGVTGGPTTPGASDAGSLVVGSTATEVTGEGTTLSGWHRVVLDDAPYLSQGWYATSWDFYTSAPASYDVASFTIEYQHYVPVEG